MAVPAFRAAGAAVFSANSVANPTSLSPTKPATAQVGDLLVLVTECRSITATVATPSGWTLLTGFPKRSATSSGGSIYVFTRIADGSASDNPTVSWTGVTTGTTGDSSGARTLAYQNAKVTQDGTVAVADAASTTAITLPAFTTTLPNSLVIGIAIRINDTAHTFTVAAPYTERSDDSTSTGTGHGTEVSDTVKTAAGTVAATTVTPSNTTSSRTLAVSVGMQAAPTIVSLTAATETDAAQAVSIKKKKTATPAAETDAAQPVTRAKHLSIVAASEADAAQVLSISHDAGQHVSLIAATEADTAQAVTAKKARPVTAATEADAAQALTGRKQATPTRAAEVDAAVHLVVGKTLTNPAAAETDAPPTLQAQKHVVIVAALETDTAPAATAATHATATPAAETDTAIAARARKVAQLTPAAEVDAADPLVSARARTLVPAVETDAAQTIAEQKRIIITAAAELDTTPAAAVTKRITLAPVAETDTSQHPTTRRIVAVVPALETDVAVAVSFSVGGTHIVNLTAARETDAAIAHIAIKRVALGAADASDSARPITAQKLAEIIAAIETDNAEALTAGAAIGAAIAGTITKSGGGHATSQHSGLASAHRCGNLAAPTEGSITTADNGRAS